MTPTTPIPPHPSAAVLVTNTDTNTDTNADTNTDTNTNAYTGTNTNENTDEIKISDHGGIMTLTPVQCNTPPSLNHTPP